MSIEVSLSSVSYGQKVVLKNDFDQKNENLYSFSHHRQFRLDFFKAAILTLKFASGPMMLSKIKSHVGI